MNKAMRAALLAALPSLAQAQTQVPAIEATAASAASETHPTKSKED